MGMGYDAQFGVGFQIECDSEMFEVLEYDDDILGKYKCFCSGNFYCEDMDDMPKYIFIKDVDIFNSAELILKVNALRKDLEDRKVKIHNGPGILGGHIVY